VLCIDGLLLLLPIVLTQRGGQTFRLSTYN